MSADKIGSSMDAIRKVFLIYDHTYVNPSQVQRESNTLVERITDIYDGNCKILRYKHDYRPGSNIFEEFNRLLNSSDMTCVIMTKESINCRMLSYDEKRALLDSIKRDKRLAIIGIGIDQQDIPDHFQTRRNIFYADFKSVQQDEFLDGIFINAEHEMEERNQTHERSPVEHEMEEEDQIDEKSPDETGIEDVKPSQVNSPDKHESQNSGRSSGRLMWIKTILNERSVLIITGIAVIAGLYGIAPYLNIHNKYIGALEFLFEYFLPFPFMTFFRRVRNYPVEDESASSGRSLFPAED